MRTFSHCERVSRSVPCTNLAIVDAQQAEIERLRNGAAALSQQPAAPSEAVNVLGMPEFDGLLDHIYECGTEAEGVIEKANAFARAVIARYAPQQPAAAGEEIMVNAAHDVYTLPLQPSGLSSGPRFVVHVPGPDQQPAAVDGLAARLVDELDGLVSESDGVSGLHLNGDVATWEELLPGGRFERLSSLDELREALAAQQPAAVDGSDAQAAEIEALRAEVAEWKRVAAAQAELHDEAEARAERLAEALRGWWEARRPVGWTEDQHRSCPHVNLATDAEEALATALLRDQEE